jgi:hypothetical protein
MYKLIVIYHQDKKTMEYVFEKIISKKEFAFEWMTYFKTNKPDDEPYAFGVFSLVDTYSFLIGNRMVLPENV